MRLKRVGVFSVGMVLGCLYGGLGLIIGGIFALISLAGATLAPPQAQGAPQIPPMFFGVFAVILVPLFYGVMGFIMGLIMAALYNIVAAVVGGIEVEFDQPYPPSYPQGPAPNP